MKYPFNVFQMQVEQHVFWVAKSAQLNGCIGQGDSMEDAINELAEMRRLGWKQQKTSDFPSRMLPLSKCKNIVEN